MCPVKLQQRPQLNAKSAKNPSKQKHILFLTLPSVYTAAECPMVVGRCHAASRKMRCEGKHAIVNGNSGCSAGEAAGAGAKGLVHIRVQEGGAIDAPKQLKEGLTEQQCQDLIAKCDAQMVRVPASTLQA